MRFRLRTLILAMAIGPPVAGVAYWRFQQFKAFGVMSDLNATMTASNQFGYVPDNLGGTTIFGWLAILLALIAAPAAIIAIRRYGLTNRDMVWAMLVVALVVGWFVHVQIKNRQRSEWYDRTLQRQANDIEWYRQALESASTDEN